MIGRRSRHLRSNGQAGLAEASPILRCLSTRTRGAVAFLLFSITAVSLIRAAPASVGAVSTHGPVRVNDNEIQGTATLLPGALITTGRASTATLLLQQRRASVLVAPQSIVHVFADHLLLDQGQVEISAGPGGAAYRVETGWVRFEVPATGHCRGTAKSISPQEYEFSADGCPASVTTPGGQPVATIPAGQFLRLRKPAAPADEFSVTGCLQREGARLLLTDEATNLKVELRGGGPALLTHVGHRIKADGLALAGARPTPGIAYVINVRTEQQLPGNCSTHR